MKLFHSATAPDYHFHVYIALISTFFFFTQLLVDLFCAKFVDYIGYRVCIVASEIFASLGLVGLAFLPDLFILLLRSCWDNFNFQPVFSAIWNNQLKMARRDMGTHSGS